MQGLHNTGKLIKPRQENHLKKDRRICNVKDRGGPLIFLESLEEELQKQTTHSRQREWVEHL
jgi:hypothetical protein